MYLKKVNKVKNISSKLIDIKKVKKVKIWIANVFKKSKKG